jgi:hypothetical protein
MAESDYLGEFLKTAEGQRVKEWIGSWELTVSPTPVPCSRCGQAEATTSFNHASLCGPCLTAVLEF